jgi:3-oxoacyl-[acyl-carrier-protein] synthase-3
MGLRFRASAGSATSRSKGNTGSASPYIMLDELFRSGRIQPGHKLLMFVPESGRFSSGFISGTVWRRV